MARGFTKLDEIPTFRPEDMAAGIAVADPAENLMERRADAWAATAKRSQTRMYLLGPDELTIWPGNGRAYDALTKEACQTLIDSIKEEKGNKVPVVARARPREQGGPRYELLVGTRRHWAVKWLNENDGLDLKLLVAVEDLTDERAFALSDIENRERADISGYARARSYEHALKAFFDGDTERLIKRLGISRAYYFRLMRMLDLPAEVYSAFPSQTDVSERRARRLLEAMAKPAARERMLAAADEIESAQALRESEGKPLLDPDEVERRLLAATRDPRGRKPMHQELRFATGKACGAVMRDDKKALVVKLVPDAFDDLEATMDAVRRTLLASRIRATRE